MIWGLYLLEDIFLLSVISGYYLNYIPRQIKIVDFKLDRSSKPFMPILNFVEILNMFFYSFFKSLHEIFYENAN